MSEKSTAKLIKLYKGVYLSEIYKHLQVIGTELSIKEVDKEIKEAAHFPYESCADERVTIEDMQNLIIWAFVYGDSIGIHLDYLPSEMDDKLDLDFERTEK